MSASLLATLLELTVATSIALLVVAIARRPVRHVAGAQVAYWLWALVPASVIAVSLPAPPVAIAVDVAAPLRGVIPVEAYLDIVLRPAVDWAAIAATVWACGAVLAAALCTGSVRSFDRSVP